MMLWILLQYKYRMNRYKGFSDGLDQYPDWAIPLAIALPFIILAGLVLYFWLKKKKR